MQKIINRVLHIIQSFQQYLKLDRLDSLEPRLIKLAEVSKDEKKKYVVVAQEAKEFLYFHKEVTKLGYRVDIYQYKLIQAAREYLEKEKIKFDIVAHKCNCGKDISLLFLKEKCSQSININLEYQL